MAARLPAQLNFRKMQYTVNINGDHQGTALITITRLALILLLNTLYMSLSCLSDFTIFQDLPNHISVMDTLGILQITNFGVIAYFNK